MVDVETPTAPSAKGGEGEASQGPTRRAGIPQSALDAANGQIGRVAQALSGAAESIDEVVADDQVALPEAVKGLAASASGTLRSYADRASAQDAGQAFEGLQRAAAAHPVAAAGVGAAVGAAMGIALAYLVKPAPDDDLKA